MSPLTSSSQTPPNAPVQEKLSALPDKPGVYLFKDSLERILYVGKASSLRHRVHSYFQQPSKTNPRLKLLILKIWDLDYVICNTEVEALLLEYNLIKEHHPPYNVLFRDDKRYPLIKVVTTDPFPYITIARKRMPDGNRYFGPYVSSSAMRKTLKAIRKVFQIRSCTMKITGHDRPCLYYHIKECTAPCISAVHQEQYKKSVQEVLNFLEGKPEPLMKELANRMEEAARHLEFERAALIRDQMNSLQQVAVRQKVVSMRDVNEDYVEIASQQGLCAAEVFHVRNGNLIGEEHFIFETIQASRGAILSEFLKKSSQETNFIPPKIFLLVEPEDKTALEKFLLQASETKSSFSLQIPKRGEKKKFMSLLEKNAQHRLELALLKELKTKGMMQALESLQKTFALPNLPIRIEGYDISNIFGEQAVGSMVVFNGGKPQKNHYRKFAIFWKDKPDDFAMMEELLTRRLQRLSEHEEDESFYANPDLILLDGGKGQLSRGVKVLNFLGLNPISILSLAKEEEEVYHPLFSQPVKLSRHDPGLKLLQHIRDEAHRFAVSYHKNKRAQKMTHSIFQDIPGMGEKRVQKLLEAFGSLDQIKVADPEQIAKVLHCPKSLAEKILEVISKTL